MTSTATSRLSSSLVPSSYESRAKSGFSIGVMRIGGSSFLYVDIHKEFTGIGHYPSYANIPDHGI
jgi:hypothetical protein